MAVYNTIPKIAAPLASARGSASAAASGRTSARGRAASAAPVPQSQKNQDHAAAIATVQWPNAYAAIGVDGVARHSASLMTRRKYSELAAGHERDLVIELRDYEASGGDLDAIRQHVDAASARAWDMFLTNYKCFLRTGDDAAVEKDTVPPTPPPSPFRPIVVVDNPLADEDATSRTAFPGSPSSGFRGSRRPRASPWPPAPGFSGRAC